MLLGLVSLFSVFTTCQTFQLSWIPTNSAPSSTSQRLVSRMGSLTDSQESLGEKDYDTNDRHTLFGRRSFWTTIVSTNVIASWMLIPMVADARLESVNRPDLLPKESGLNVIQTEPFLTSGQARRMNTLLTSLERDTGYRVRVLCQNYPNTPGLAIRDYWDLGKEGAKDDKYVVLVVDQFGGRGNVLNFNVGEGVKFVLPNVFWTRLTGKYGTVSNMVGRDESKTHFSSFSVFQIMITIRLFTSGRMELILRS
jgi:TPM domain